MRSPYLPEPGSITPTRDKRVRIAGYGPGNWRTEVPTEDGLSGWDITGPPYATKAEALASIDYALWVAFGVPVPGRPASPASGYTDRAGIDSRANSALGRISRISAMTHYPSAVRLALIAQVMAGEPILTDTGSPAAYEVRALAARMPEYPESKSI
jgi:hypothetical protein